MATKCLIAPFKISRESTLEAQRERKRARDVNKRKREFFLNLIATRIRKFAGFGKKLKVSVWNFFVKAGRHRRKVIEQVFHTWHSFVLTFCVAIGTTKCTFPLISAFCFPGQSVRDSKYSC